MSNKTRSMATIGLIQGLLLLFLNEWTTAGSRLWSQPSLVLFLLCAMSATPLAWYLTEGIDGLSARRRRGIVLFLGVGLALLGACEGWTSLDGMARIPTLALVCPVLGFIAVPLLAHAQRRSRWTWQWNYASLFETSWRNAMVLVVAMVLTGILWGVLFAGAALMSSIGIDMVLHLMLQSWFFLPVTTTVFACAIALALTRTETIAGLRRFWLSMNQAFLPLVLLFSAMWTIALPFTGLNPVLNTRMAGFSLLWFAALAVNFVNAAYQDGLAAPPFNPWLRRVLSVAWLSMLMVVGVAGIAIFKRVEQYGWSEDRVWGVFVLLIAAGYALGYALSIRSQTKGWMRTVGPTNVVMTLALCVGLIALSTPLADARRIAAASQVNRLLAGKTPMETFDFDYLRRETGIYGVSALQALADGVPDHPQSARLAELAQAAKARKPWQSGKPVAPAPSDDDLRTRWKLLPDGTPAPPAMVDALLARLHSGKRYGDEATCLKAGATCDLWMGDLDGDTAPELLLAVNHQATRAAIVYRWQSASGELSRVATIDRVSAEWIAALRQGQTTVIPNPWPDIEAGGSRVRIVPMQ